MVSSATVHEIDRKALGAGWRITETRDIAKIRTYWNEYGKEEGRTQQTNVFLYHTSPGRLQLERKPTPTDSVLKRMVGDAHNQGLDDPEHEWSSRTLSVNRIGQALNLFPQSEAVYQWLLEELLSFLEDDPYPCVRAEAARILSLSSAQEAIPSLEKALEDESILVRINSAHSIMRIARKDNRKAIEVLSQVALGNVLTGFDDEALIKAGVLYSEFGSHNKDRPYANKLTERWRLAAIQGLCESSDEYAARVLEELAKSDDTKIMQFIKRCKMRPPKRRAE